MLDLQWHIEDIHFLIVNISFGIKFLW